jgi:hypothetical protein
MQSKRGQFLDLSSDFRIASYSSPLDGPQLSIADPQQVFPSAKVILEAHALGDLEGRDHTSFDLLSAFSGSLAN